MSWGRLHLGLSDSEKLCVHVRGFLLKKEKEHVTPDMVLQKGAIDTHACSFQTTFYLATFISDVHLYVKIMIATP